MPSTMSCSWKTTKSFKIDANELNSAGAAGNFLASIEQLSVNAFKSVMDIDVLGSYNTVKATLPYLIKSGGQHRMDPESRKLESEHHEPRHRNNPCVSQPFTQRHWRKDHLRQRHPPL